MDWSAKVREHFDNAVNVYGQNNVWVTMLYGSQNYNMATEASDVDVKTMLFPTVRDTVLGKKTDSTDIALPDGSLNGVKDYRDTFDLYLRGNVRYLETLYSDYQVVNPKYQFFFDQLIANRELVANSLPRKLMYSAAGMAEQKYKALDHPYPSKVDVIAKYGYDLKQLHHLARLWVFMTTYIQTLSFEASLRPNESDRMWLLGLKRNALPLDIAREQAEKYIKLVRELVRYADSYLPESNNYKQAKDFLDTLIVDLFNKRYFSGQSS